MNIKLTQAYGVLIGLLALFGLFADGHLFGLTNSDIALDGIRVALAATLLYIGFITKDARQAGTALLATGVLYLGMAVLGMASSTLFGLLPSGLTGFDIGFHLVTGAIATWAGMRKSNELHLAH